MINIEAALKGVPSVFLIVQNQWRVSSAGFRHYISVIGGDIVIFTRIVPDHGAVCVCSIYFEVSFRSTNVLYYLCRCHGGNIRQPLPKAPAHHGPAHNNFPEKLSNNQLSFASIRSNYSRIAEFGNCCKEMEGRSLFYLKMLLAATCIICRGNHFKTGSKSGHRRRKLF